MTVTVYPLQSGPIGDIAIAVSNDQGEIIEIRRSWGGGYCTRAEIDELPYTAYDSEGDRLWELAESFSDWPTLQRPYQPLNEILEGIYE